MNTGEAPHSGQSAGATSKSAASRATGQRPAVSPPSAAAHPGAPGSRPLGPRPIPPVARPAGPRTVRLALGRIDPWSAMKIGFLLSVAMGIVTVVVTVVLWITLNTMGVFADISGTIGTIEGNSSSSKFDLMAYISFGRVVSLSTVIAVINVFILTAVATLGALLYNISAGLVGGAQLTLTDD